MDRFVLVIEDDQTIRDLITEVFAESGYEARAVATMDEAAKHLQNPGCQLIVTDLNAPFYTPETRDLVWKEALAPLRLGRAVPIIVITGHSAAIAEDPAERGVQAILAKPFQIDELLAEAETALAAPGNDDQS